MNIYFTIWGLLPLALGALTIWSWIKLQFLGGEKEQIGMFARQCIFSLIALGLSAPILLYGVVESINENILFGYMEESFLNWLIYPVVLVALAKLGDRGVNA